MKALGPCKYCGWIRYQMANGTILQTCNCWAYQDQEEQLESQRRAEEECDANDQREPDATNDG